MKRVMVYEKYMAEYTKFNKIQLKEVVQVSIFYGDKEFKNHDIDTDNIRLLNNFYKVFDASTKKAVENYIFKLGRKNYEMFERNVLKQILSEV